MKRQVLCNLSDLGVDEAREFEIGEPVSTSVMVMKTAVGPKAYLNICPHAGRPLNWAPGQFLFTPGGKLVCAAHGATFEPATGLATGGPCVGSSLTEVVIEVDADGCISIATDILDNLNL